MRLIDADLLKSRFIPDSEYDSNVVREAINLAPSIDIVRCWECTKWFPPCLEETVGWCKMTAHDCEPDDFCSYGERADLRKPTKEFTQAEQTEPCDECIFVKGSGWCDNCNGKPKGLGALPSSRRAEQTEPKTCEDCKHWNDTEDGCADRHGCKTEPKGEE